MADNSGPTGGHHPGGLDPGGLAGSRLPSLLPSSTSVHSVPHAEMLKKSNRVPGLGPLQASNPKTALTCFNLSGLAAGESRGADRQ